MRQLLAAILVISLSGCTLWPRMAHQTLLHNPYPQLSKVAVAPFINLSSEKTLNGRQFALAYFNELQLIPGYEVVPLDVVETAIRTNHLPLNGPEDARKLAQILGVDAVVIGAVTDFSPYYPPRCTMRIEWYAANPGFHPIPPGYGLPWGTKAAKKISPSIVFESEMALAKEQLRTQTPLPPGAVAAGKTPPPAKADDGPPAAPLPDDVQKTAYQRPAPGTPPSEGSPGPNGVADTIGGDARAITNSSLGPGPVGGPDPRPPWPDRHGFVPPPPSPVPPAFQPTLEPVMTHTQAFNGHDVSFTDALEDYYLLRDDARFGGWQSYLQRSDDFIRFCCYLHLREMLAARGGAGETKVVWRWPLVR